MNAKLTALKRGLLGIPLGIAIGFMISLFVSLGMGTGDYYGARPELIAEMGSELNAIRIKVDEMMARRAVVRREFDELQRFRSFRNAKGVKDAADDDNEIAELKRKYAKAT